MESTTPTHFDREDWRIRLLRGTRAASRRAGTAEVPAATGAPDGTDAGIDANADAVTEPQQHRRPITSHETTAAARCGH